MRTIYLLTHFHLCFVVRCHRPIILNTTNIRNTKTVIREAAAPSVVAGAKPGTGDAHNTQC